jgi:hypothetical protein
LHLWAVNSIVSLRKGTLEQAPSLAPTDTGFEKEPRPSFPLPS